METTTGGDDPVRLATFERRNRDTGSVEEIRLEVSEFKGKPVISARVWYRSRGGPAGPDDDGWRPSKAGFTIREHEFPIWTGALERAGAMLAERPGRNTRESRRDQPAARRGAWSPPLHERSSVYRASPLANRLPTRDGSTVSEFGEGRPDG